MVESIRLDKINSLIQQKVGEFILQEVEIPAECFVTVKKAETTSNIRFSKIYVSILPHEKRDEIFKLIIKNKKFIQNKLSKNIETRNTPKLQFILDIQEEKASSIDTLLDGISKN